MRATRSRFTGSPSLRTVEIHDVQPARAERAVAGRELERIHVVARLLGEIALEQSHAAAVAQIDGGDQFHWMHVSLKTHRKLSSIRAPTLDDRSGWNCVPKKLRCPITAENGPPYSVTARV